jgi:ubiquitin-like protein Pup
MKFLNLLTASLCTAAASAAAVALPETSYHYFKSDGTEVLLKNYSQPITIGGVAIGTIELPSHNASGTVHSLTSGHHFGHRDWVITRDGDGYSWTYKEGFSDRRSNCKFKMVTPKNQTEAVGKTTLRVRGRNLEYITDTVDAVLDEIDDVLEEEYYNYVTSYVIQHNTGILPPYPQISWSAGGPATYGEMSLFAANDFTVDPILSIASLADDIVNILFDAWGFFVN